MARRVAKQHPVYSVHPSVAMVQAWVAGLPGKTGKSLDEWIAIVRKEGPSTEKERSRWLQEKRGLGANAAWWIAERSLKTAWMDGGPDVYLKSAEGFVASMFDEEKSGLRPIFDALIHLGMELGPDVRICPCRTMVPLYRQHVFARIKPADGRIELGLALRDAPQAVPPRLADTEGFGATDRITHQFLIGRPADVDAEVRRWLKVAYDLDA